MAGDGCSSICDVDFINLRQFLQLDFEVFGIRIATCMGDKNPVKVNVGEQGFKILQQALECFFASGGNFFLTPIGPY